MLLPPIVFKNTLELIAHRWGVPENLAYEYFIQVFDDYRPRISFKTEDDFFVNDIGQSRLAQGQLITPFKECISTENGWKHRKLEVVYEDGQPCDDLMREFFNKCDGDRNKFQEFLENIGSLSVHCPVFMQEYIPYALSLSSKHNKFCVDSVFFEDEEGQEIKGAYHKVKPLGLPCTYSGKKYDFHYKSYEMQELCFSLNELFLYEDSLKELEQKMEIFDHGLKLQDTTFQNDSLKVINTLQYKRERVFEYWLDIHGYDGIVDDLTRNQVWNKLQELNRELFATGKDDFFKKQNLVKFKLGVRKKT